MFVKPMPSSTRRVFSRRVSLPGRLITATGVSKILLHAPSDARPPGALRDVPGWWAKAGKFKMSAASATLLYASLIQTFQADSFAAHYDRLFRSADIPVLPSCTCSRAHCGGSPSRRSKRFVLVTRASSSGRPGCASKMWIRNR